MDTPENRNDRLAEDLRALRPTPHPQFAAELDKRAAAGFPRRSRLPRFSFARLRALPPRRLMLATGALAVVAIAVTGVLVTANDTSEQQSGSSELGFLNLYDGKGDEPAPTTSPPVEASAEEAQPSRGNEGDAGSALNFDGGGGYGQGSAPLTHRAVRREAQVVLGTDPAHVAENATEVLETVRANDGIVLRSSSHQGPEGEAGAHFELRFPSAKLTGALAALSEIGELRSRYDTSLDITAPTVKVGELLQDSKARIDSLLGQLEGAETESEREAVEAELRQERHYRARLRMNLQKLQRKAQYSLVTVRIETDAVEDSSGGGAWGIDDAIDDAGHILAIAAAVIVVGLAILGPIALIGLLVYLTHRAWVRRERRRVLG
jgi:Domain of unknown function (DUF4349)